MKSYLLGYNSERCDPVSGMTHLGNGYRTYNPGLQRFACPDSWSPFGPGGMNPYIYCAGDPINRADPSGHFSWQAGLGIAFGALGILATAFTAGTSLAAAASLSAALTACSLTALAVGTAGMMADVTGVVSTLTTHSNPKASTLLGWISFASGILSLGTGLAAGGYRMLNKPAMESSYIAMAAVPQLSASDAAAPLTLETFSQNPMLMTIIMRKLSGTDLDSLRATSKTMQSRVESLLTPLERILPERNFTEFLASYPPDYPHCITKYEFTNADYIDRIRSVWRGDYPLTSPSQLSKYEITPLEQDLVKLKSINPQKMFHLHSLNDPAEWEAIVNSDTLFKSLVHARNQKFKQWQTSFRALHTDEFANI